MSVHAIEKALWMVCSNPANAQAMAANSTTYLSQFHIDDAERAMLSDWDVDALGKHGVNPMLMLMSFGAVRGNDAMGEYIMKINNLPGGPPPA